jgi:uncharacterized protein (TIGR02246 family)
LDGGEPGGGPRQRPQPDDRRRHLHGARAAAVGKEAFRAASEAPKNVQLDGQARIEELQVLGDWAYLRNYIDITVTPPSGEPVRRSGYTLTVLRKEPDGRWRLARDANLVV